MPSVLITGAAGFLGSHLARRLVGDKWDVHVLLRQQADLWRLSDVVDDLTVWRGDVTDAAFLAHTIGASRPEIVFHLAGDVRGRRTSADFAAIRNSLEANLVHTLALLGALHDAGVKTTRFVRVGSLEEYGNSPYPSIESQREHPISPYTASQTAAAHYCVMLGQYLKFSLVTLRASLIYGPAQAGDFFIPSLILACLQGQPFAMTSGTQSRDLLFIDDMVDALVLAANVPEAGGEIFNIAAGQEHQLTTIAQTIMSATGAPIELRVGAKPRSAAEIQHVACSIGKAAEILRWKPKTSLEDGLAKTIDWYRANAATTT